MPHPQSKPSVALTPLEQRKQKITFWPKLYSIAFAIYMLGDILYNFCCIGALSDGSADIYELYEAMQGFSMMSWILGIPAGIFIAVTFYFFVVRIWEEVPTEFARTTPQKAAGLSFIPFYNFYWWFQCFLGLFQDMNKVTEHYGKGTKFFAPLIQGACIFWVAACVIELILTDEIGILGRYDGYRIFLSFVNAGVTIPILWYIRQQVLNFIDFKTEIGIETSDHRS